MCLFYLRVQLNVLMKVKMPIIDQISGLKVAILLDGKTHFDYPVWLGLLAGLREQRCAGNSSLSLKKVVVFFIVTRSAVAWLQIYLQYLYQLFKKNVYKK